MIEQEELTPEQEAEQERQSERVFEDMSKQLELFPERDAQKKQGNAKGK